MSRFEARADVEALIDHLIDDDQGAEQNLRGNRSRHLSVSSMIESGTNQVQKETDERIDRDDNWRVDLIQRMERIEEVLLKLSNQRLNQ